MTSLTGSHARVGRETTTWKELQNDGISCCAIVQDQGAVVTSLIFWMGDDMANGLEVHFSNNKKVGFASRGCVMLAGCLMSIVRVGGGNR